MESLHSLSISAIDVISGQEYIIDHSYRNYRIDSIYAVVKDSSITFNLAYADLPYGSGTYLFNISPGRK